MSTVNSSEIEKKLCECCADNKPEFTVYFTDDLVNEVCSKCVSEYFQEIPDEISYVEAI